MVCGSGYGYRRADADLRWRQRFDNFERRNQSSHTYNLEQAQVIARDVIDRFEPLFGALRERFTALSQEQS
ncbi:MAG: hypothetical protein NTY67_02520 [Cyanobacteria bacterium]|nr:hypothetical protein [Cyanobacteriota bacterium]